MTNPETPSPSSNRSRAESLYHAIEDLAVEAVARAGALVLSRFSGPLDIQRKDDATRSLVTDVDLASQKLIRDIVQDAFPAHLVLGEEDAPGEAPCPPDFVWAVDPIDGTTNFANGFPIFAVSAGVLYRGHPVVGACYLPWPCPEGYIVIRARRGGGAWFGASRLALDPDGDDASPPASGRLSLLPGGASHAYRIGKPLRRSPGEVRTTGSAVYELIMAARGMSQYVLTGAVNVWDCAAAVVIVTEAGGSALTLETGRDGKPGKRWAPLETFAEDYDSSPATFKKLRSWKRPLIAGRPGIARFVSRQLTPRRPSRWAGAARRLFR